MAKRVFFYFAHLLLRGILALRYNIQVKGLSEIKKRSFSKEGILFLPNHPAEVDPLILLTFLWPKFQPHPIVLEMLFQNGLMRPLLKFVGALAVPNFETASNSYKKLQIEKTYETIISLLGKGENFLIYPAGGLKHQAEEVVGGASGVHHILQNSKAEVVLIRTTGLWGSSFSRAYTGKSPDVISAYLNGLKILLKNLIFFSPRRNVLIEMEVAQNLPKDVSRLEFNQYLENWYNKKVEPLYLVRNYFWSKELPKIQPPKIREMLSLEGIPENVKEKVFEELSRLSNFSKEKLEPSLDLSQDLGLDSLDQAELTLFLKENFGVPQLNSSELTLVEDVLAIAAGIKKPTQEEEEETFSTLWGKETGRPEPEPPHGETIIEAFLNTAEKMDQFLACRDDKSGEFSYRKFKLGVILLSLAIKKIPENRVGIMMPASVAVNMVILATQLAGKVPVMINWTLGIRNLEAIVEVSKLKYTLTSWAFINRLSNVDLNDLNERLIFVEDIRRSLTWKMKLKALKFLRKKPKELLRIFGIQGLKQDSDAVILFTSGTENVPKGVPLTHGNILSNQRDAYSFVSLKKDDVFLGVLPPFHSFGFSVTGLLPLLSGIKVSYAPNPGDARKILSHFEKWGITLFCVAPTFLKNVLKIAQEKQFAHLRLLVLGAEKATDEIFEKVSKLNPNISVIEGYGITECAPILTLNPPGKKRKGVGVLLPHVKALVVHPETEEKLGKNNEGHILAHGPNVFRGYLDPKIASPFVEIDGLSWYKTGDLGSLDDENYLTLTGRLKRFVKIGGEMVSLQAIEEVLIKRGSILGWKINSEVPSLAAIAVEEGDKKSLIVLFTSFPVTTDEANRELKNDGFSNLVKISKIVVLPFIPLLGTGKVDYRTLQQKLKDK